MATHAANVVAAATTTGQRSGLFQGVRRAAGQVVLVLQPLPGGKYVPGIG